MMNDNLQSQILTMKYRLDQIYREFLEMGPSLKNGLTRIGDLEKKSSQIDELASLHQKFDFLEQTRLTSASILKGKQDAVNSELKSIKDDLALLRTDLSLHATNSYKIKMELDDLKKTMANFCSSVESMHKNALDRCRHDFHRSIQDIQKDLDESSVPALSSNLSTLNELYTDIIARMQKYDKNFQTVDKRLSTINLYLVKQCLDKRE